MNTPPTIGRAIVLHVRLPLSCSEGCCRPALDPETPTQTISDASLTSWARLVCTWFAFVLHLVCVARGGDPGNASKAMRQGPARDHRHSVCGPAQNCGANPKQRR